jgi:hypothetical protein
VYPNPTFTSGAVLTTDASLICTPGYASSARDVSTATKEQVYAEYGVSYPQALGAYEVDHFIPLEIGGSNDITNLWPEPATPTPGFHQKDQFENFEHGQVCNGTISVAEAQSRMASDWYFYWEEEVGGTSDHTSASTVRASTIPISSGAASHHVGSCIAGLLHLLVSHRKVLVSCVLLGLAELEQGVYRGLSNTRGSVSEVPESL